MKKELSIIFLVVVSGAIILLFWNNGFVYSLAMRHPLESEEVMPYKPDDLKQKIETGKHPLFTHFFNPYCPCSRFNISLFKSRFKRHQKKQAVKMLAANNDRSFASKHFQNTVLYNR